MASFSYNVSAQYHDAVGTFTFTSSSTLGGTISDGEPDSTFEFGDTVGPGDFVGTYVINGETMVVVQVGSTYLFYGHVPDPFAFTWDSSIVEPSFNDADFAVCFAPGTGILTPDGERAVETLAMGDTVLTADGRAVPVRWLGRQTLHRATTPAERFVPVRVRAGALAPGVPHADLVLTPDHALILDGLAINASALVNGTTIAYEDPAGLPDTVTYHHVETEGHEVILANGAPAETFVDHVGRRAFDNHAEYLAHHGEDRPIAEMDRPRVSAARLVPPSIRRRLGIERAA